MCFGQVSMKEQNLNIVRREERMQQDLERASNEVLTAQLTA